MLDIFLGHAIDDDLGDGFMIVFKHIIYDTVCILYLCKCIYEVYTYMYMYTCIFIPIL